MAEDTATTLHEPVARVERSPLGVVLRHALAIIALPFVILMTLCILPFILIFGHKDRGWD